MRFLIGSISCQVVSRNLIRPAATIFSSFGTCRQVPNDAVSTIHSSPYNSHDWQRISCVTDYCSFPHAALKPINTSLIISLLIFCSIPVAIYRPSQMLCTCSWINNVHVFRAVTWSRRHLEHSISNQLNYMYLIYLHVLLDINQYNFTIADIFTQFL